jgi:hypothetical protein
LANVSDPDSIGSVDLDAGRQKNDPNTYVYPDSWFEELDVFPGKPVFDPKN